MQPFIGPLTGCAALLCAAAAFGQGQAAPTMNQEPHHQRLTYIRHMRVFQLTLAPGESTADYVLDYDSAGIPLTDGRVRKRVEGGDWSAPRSAAQAMAELAQVTGMPMPLSQRLENAGTTTFRAIVVENLREGKWTMPMALTAPGTSLQQDNRSFAVYDMRLNAATSRTVHTHQNPSFVFLVSGAVQAQGGGGESDFRMDPTRTWWFPGSGPDQPHTIELAAGSSDAHVICVEAK